MDPATILLAQALALPFVTCRVRAFSHEPQPPALAIDCGPKPGKGRAELTQSRRYYWGEISAGGIVGAVQVKRLFVIGFPVAIVSCWERADQVLCADDEALREAYWSQGGR